MEYPSSKRRKTSPTTRIDIDASKSQRQASSRHGNHGSQSRASFMSPTKASLSRFNPNLLRRPGSAEPPRLPRGSHRDSRKAQTEEREIEQYADKEIEKNADRGLQEAAKVNGHGHANEDPSSSILEETPSKLPPRQTAARGAGATQEQQLRLRTPTHDRKQQNAVGKDKDHEDEPSLPSTPSQLGLEPPAEKPRGLLFQSPGRRRVHQSRTHTKTSPLKLSERTEPRVPVSQDQITSMLGPRDSSKALSNVGSDSQISGRDLISVTQTKLARRLRALQDDLTRLCIQSPSVMGEKERNKKQTRMRRQLTQDARVLPRDAVFRAPESMGNSNANFKPHPANPHVSTGPRSVFSRLVHLSPFSHKPDMPEEDLAPRASLDSENSPLELDVHITNSEIVTAANDLPHIRQSLQISMSRHEVFSQLQFLVDPHSQNVSDISTDRMVAWAAPDFAPWLLNETSQWTLPTIGNVLRRYLNLVQLRAQSWSRCKNTLPNIFVSQARDQNSIELIKAPLKLSIWWRLIIDDGGKVQSDVSLEPEVPSQWRKLDTLGDLDRLGEAFEGLIRKHGVSEAVRIMSKVLFPP